MNEIKLVPKKLVDVVIPHYGDDKDLNECVDSFSDIDCVNEVKIVDNNKDNVGFSAGVNKGIRETMRNLDVPFVGVVNNDTVAVKDPFILLSTLMVLPNAAIVAPKIVDYSNRDQIIAPIGLQAFPNGIHKSGLVSLDQLSKPEKCKWLSFVVVFIRKEAILDVGLLDEKMFLVGSDSDWCFRARYAGWECWYQPESVWAHKIGESGRPTSVSSINIQRRDMYRFYKKWIARDGGIYQELDLEVMPNASPQSKKKG
jgi:GT2 family glycosyltransferase